MGGEVAGDQAGIIAKGIEQPCRLAPQFATAPPSVQNSPHNTHAFDPA